MGSFSAAARSMAMLRWGNLAQACAGLALLAAAFFSVGGLWGILVPLFLYLFFMAMIRPNATVMAMAPFKHCAGTASALLGALQFGLFAGVAFVVGLCHSKSAVPMSATIACCGLVSALVCRRALQAKRQGLRPL